MPSAKKRGFVSPAGGGHEANTMTQPILATCGSYLDGKMPERLAGLLASGLWDSLAPDDRCDFTARGIVRDTASGEAIFRWLCLVYRIPNADYQLELRRKNRVQPAAAQQGAGE
jgi:hypothetical protein